MKDGDPLSIPCAIGDIPNAKVTVSGVLKNRVTATRTETQCDGCRVTFVGLQPETILYQRVDVDANQQPINIIVCRQ